MNSTLNAGEICHFFRMSAKVAICLMQENNCFMCLTNRFSFRFAENAVYLSFLELQSSGIDPHEFSFEN